MIQAFGAFTKQLLVSGGFKIPEFPPKAYRELLTGFERLQEEQLVILPGMIELAKTHPGYLEPAMRTTLLSSTSNPLPVMATTSFSGFTASSGSRNGKIRGYSSFRVA